jgi:hypothetical protein
MPTIQWLKYTIIVRLVPIFLITMYIIYFESLKTSGQFDLNSPENEFLLGE